MDETTPLAALQRYRGQVGTDPEIAPSRAPWSEDGAGWPREKPTT
jgi:hypothetical protein